MVAKNLHIIYTGHRAKVIDYMGYSPDGVLTDTIYQKIKYLGLSDVLHSPLGFKIQICRHYIRHWHTSTIRRLNWFFIQKRVELAIIILLMNSHQGSS